MLCREQKNLVKHCFIYKAQNDFIRQCRFFVLIGTFPFLTVIFFTACFSSDLGRTKFFRVRGTRGVPIKDGSISIQSIPVPNCLRGQESTVESGGVVQFLTQYSNSGDKQYNHLIWYVWVGSEQLCSSDPSNTTICPLPLSVWTNNTEVLLANRAQPILGTYHNTVPSPCGSYYSWVIAGLFLSGASPIAASGLMVNVKVEEFHVVLYGKA